VDHEIIRELTAAYALDALDRADEREFEDHLAHCADCRDDVAAFQEVAALLAYDVETPAPPAVLRERILQQARAERPNVVPLRRRWAFPVAAGIAAVAACAAIGLGVWAAGLSSKLDSERSARGDRERLVAVLADLEAARIPVSGAQGTLVVARTGEAALLVTGLEPAPEGKVYEAWVIEEGRPVPAGTFSSGGESTTFVLDRPVPQGAVVAVTLETGPVEEPTGEPLFSATV